MSVINWGIVGLGNIAHKFADGFKYLKNSRLKGISSKDDLKLSKSVELITFLSWKILSMFSKF